MDVVDQDGLIVVAVALVADTGIVPGIGPGEQVEAAVAAAYLKT